MSNGLAKAYFIWQTPSKNDMHKKVEYVRTKDGREISRVEWNKKAFEMITEADLRGLLEEVEEYVSVSCPWVKKSHIREYSMDCILKGSYKKWNDFHYQEKLAI